MDLSYQCELKRFTLFKDLSVQIGVYYIAVRL